MNQFSYLQGKFLYINSALVYSQLYFNSTLVNIRWSNIVQVENRKL